MKRIIRLEKGEKKKSDGIIQEHNQLLTMAGVWGVEEEEKDRKTAFTDDGGV